MSDSHPQSDIPPASKISLDGGEEVLAKAEIGLVGFFDILGYKSFLANNAADDALSAQVIDRISGIPAQVRQQVAEIGAGHDDENLRAATRDLRTLVFSDTVLFTMPCGPSSSLITARWLLFSYASALLQREMFDAGLPIRGGIAFGSYLVRQNSFMGAPIIEAHAMCESVDGAMVALAASAIAAKPQGRNDWFVQYCVPLKSAEEKQGYALDFVNLPGVSPGVLTGDPRALVARAFSRHGKSVPPAVHQKLTNTELFVRAIRRF